MSLSDFLRRLSNTVFGWPKIDESPLVLPGMDTAPPVECVEPTTTSLTVFIPIIILILLMDEGDGLPGNKVIQDIGGTYNNVFTDKDMQLAETDYGINFLWTQSVRVAAKSLVSRGLIIIEAKDKWRITPAGMECGRRIHAGDNEAWLSYDSPEPEPVTPEPAQLKFIHEETTVPNPIEAIRSYNDLSDGVVQGMRLLRKDGSEIHVPMPKFPPLGRTDDGCAYHRSAEVNVLALWMALEDFGGVITPTLVSRLTEWYEGKLTEHDNLEVGNRKTHFKRHISNLTHDLKRQKLIIQQDITGSYHVTEKGFQAVVSSLKEHGIPT